MKLKIQYKLAVYFCLSFLLFGGVSLARADYYAQGTMKSTNLLVGAEVTAINSFTVDSTIPAGTTVSVQFSQDRHIFYSSAGTKGGWDSLSAGEDEVDLSGLSWDGAVLYYKLKLETTDSALTPVVNDTTLDYTGTEADAPGGTIYHQEGAIVSTNMVGSTGERILAVNSIDITTDIPAGTSVAAQFSEDGESWYSSSGTANGWDSLVDEENLIDLSGLEWTSSLYYKAKLETIDGAMISKITEVEVDYDSGGPADPVGYWSFDEGFGTTAYDESSQGNDGTLTNGPVWKDESECVSGKCLYFDGTDDSVAISNFQFPIFNQFSTTQFFNFQTLAVSKPITAQWGDSQNAVLIKLDDTNSDEIKVCIADALTDDCTNYGITTDADISANSWYNLQIVYDGAGSENSDKIKLYLDGIEKTLSFTGTIPTAFPESSEGLEIGGDTDLATYTNGKIDEVKIYPYARTAGQIKQDYNAGLSGVKSSRGTSVSFGGKSDKWMSDGLVGHWKMDEASWDGTAGEVLDASGNGNDGTRTGDATTAGGKYGNGGIFDGDGDLITRDSTASLELTMAGTISTWIKQSGADQDTYAGYVAKTVGGNPVNVSYALYHYDDSNVIRGIICDDSACDIVEIPELSMSDTDWHHFIFSWDGSSLYLYQDGILLNTETQTIVLDVESTDKFKIGGDCFGLSSYSDDFNGQIDEVRIYNRALSPDEVKGLYEYAPGPVLHLKMDEKVAGDAQTLYDISGNENNGTTVDGANDSGMDCSVLGKYGSACEFDGTDDYVDVGNDATLKPGANNFSVGGWFKHAAVDSFEIIFGKAKTIPVYQQWTVSSGSVQSTGSTNPSKRISVMLIHTGGNLVFSAYTDTDIIDGNWHYVSLVREGADYPKLYIDGIEQGLTITKAWGPFNFDVDTDNSFKIGGNGVNANFTGQIDDVKYYNYARTQSQILEDMNGGGPANKSPILHLNFDEGRGATAYDSSGFSNDGTLIPGTLGTNTTVSSMWDKNGKMGGAMEFDGSDDYVEIQDTALFIDMQQYTLSAWINPVILDTSQRQGIMGWGLYGTQRAVNALRLVENSVCPGGDGLVNYWWSDDFRECNLGLSVGEWNHVLVTYNGFERAMYVDGELKNTNTPTGSPSFKDGKFTVGTTGEGEVADFKGQIDEVKVWNYALTEDEVRQEYANSGSAVSMGGERAEASDDGTEVGGFSSKYCIPGDTAKCSPPVLELSMDEKSGTTAYDTSGNGNDGTLTNGPSWVRGKYGSALDFDGVDDYVDLGTYPKISSEDTVYTISAWMKSSSDNSIGISRGNSGNCYYNPSVTLNSVNESGCSGLNQLLLGTNTDGLWHNVTAVRSGDDFKAYLDGKLMASKIIASHGLTDSTFTPEARIGSYYKSIGSSFKDGIVDQVVVYDYARTPAQIAWDYNRGKPVAHWKMDEGTGTTVHDESGNDNDGTMTNMDANTDWVDGHSGEALDFDGADDYVEIANSSICNINEELTISMWVRPAIVYDSSLSDYRVMLDRQWTAENDSYFFGFNADGKMHLGSNGGSIQSTQSVWNANQWYFITGTYRDVGGVYSGELYVDGVSEVLSIDNYDDMEGGSNSIGIGGSDRFDKFNGQIDDVQIFNYALTEEQIKNLYNGSAMRFE